MENKTQISEKLNVINRLYQSGYQSQLIDISLSKIIDFEKNKAIEQIVELEVKLREYENIYEIQSDEFYGKFMKGELGDSMDFTEWSIFYDMWKSIQKRLDVLGR